MPSHRVTGSTLSLSVFDVIGQDGEEIGFVIHTGLAEWTGSQDAANVSVLDMGPPLHGQSRPDHVHANVVGNAALTDDEVQKIKTFADRHANEHSAFVRLSTRQLLQSAPEMYCVYPHASPLCEEDGRQIRMRFSCAGFVFEAYKKARIKLLDLNVLPMVDFSVIRLAYPVYARFIENETISAEALGIDGSGPWPILLCGYLFHSLNRDGEVIRREPYSPRTEDRYFT